MKRPSSDDSAFESCVASNSHSEDGYMHAFCLFLWCHALVAVAIEITTDKCAQISFIA